LEENTDTALDGCLAERKYPQVGMEGVLVPLIGLEERQMFHRALILVRLFQAPLEGDGGRFYILYRRREADAETTGASTAIEGDEQEDEPNGKDGGNGGDLLGYSKSSRR
jgi:hypothetical protein